MLLCMDDCILTIYIWKLGVASKYVSFAYKSKGLSKGKSRSYNI